MARWQPRQAFAQAVTSVERPFKKYLEEMRRRVAHLLCDDAQTWTGTESLYLWAEDLAEGHILEIQG